jgi:aldehyde dehydrogenase (NAD+)
VPTVKEILVTMDYGPAPEAENHVNAWLEQHKDGFRHFIDGRFVASRGKETF